MSIKILKHGHNFLEEPTMCFLCDTETDIADLPTQTTNGKFDGVHCGAGSFAIIAEGHTLKILNNKGEWV